MQYTPVVSTWSQPLVPVGVQGDREYHIEPHVIAHFGDTQIWETYSSDAPGDKEAIYVTRGYPDGTVKLGPINTDIDPEGYTDEIYRWMSDENTLVVVVWYDTRPYDDDPNDIWVYERLETWRINPDTLALTFVDAKILDESFWFNHRSQESNNYHFRQTHGGYWVDQGNGYVYQAATLHTGYPDYADCELYVNRYIVNPATSEISDASLIVEAKPYTNVNLGQSGRGLFHFDFPFHAVSIAPGWVFVDESLDFDYPGNTFYIEGGYRLYNIEEMLAAPDPNAALRLATPPPVAYEGWNAPAYTHATFVRWNIWHTHLNGSVVFQVDRVRNGVSKSRFSAWRFDSGAMVEVRERFNTLREYDDLLPVGGNRMSVLIAYRQSGYDQTDDEWFEARTGRNSYTTPHINDNSPEAAHYYLGEVEGWFAFTDGSFGHRTGAYQYTRWMPAQPLTTKPRVRIYPRDDMGRIYPTPTAAQDPGHLFPGYR